MKKSLLPLFLVLVLLAGCSGEPAGCAHQWLPADCASASTCSLCQATTGTPLSHDWQAATCTAPRTCLRCGTAEGEPLPHSWVAATCLAPKNCPVCGTTEGDPLPHRLDNWWRIPDRDIMDQCCIDCNNWANVDVPYDRELFLRDYACGIWGNVDAQGASLLCLNPDMTFTLNEDIQGTWSYTLEETNIPPSRTWVLEILLTGANGRPAGAASLTVGSGTPNQELEDILNMDQLHSLSLQLRTPKSITLYSMNNVYTEQVKTRLFHPDQLLLGSWSGTYTMLSDKGRSLCPSDPGYTIEFREDGSFRLLLDQEYIGTWRYVKTTLEIADENFPDSGFNLYSSYSLEVKRTSPQQEIPQLKIFLLDNQLQLEKNGHENLYFFTPDEEPIPEEKRNLLVGDWFVTAQRFNTGWEGSWKETSDPQFVADKQITFSPDGRFHASWDGSKTGRWLYTGSTINTYPFYNGSPCYYEVLHYMLQFDGEDTAQDINISCLSDSTQYPMSIGEYGKDTLISRWFTRCTQEEAEFCASAGDTVLGSWRAEAAYTWNPETGAVDLPMAPWDYRLTFFQDGVLQITEGTEETGTWEQSLTYTPEMGVAFYLKRGQASIPGCHLIDENTIEITLYPSVGIIRLILHKE